MTSQNITWFLVADAGRARLFAAEGPAAPWIELESHVHPRSRLHGADLVADRPGRAFQRTTSGRAAMEPATDPREVEDRRFADELADRLLAGHREGAYRELVLIAPPRFLGHLRAALDPTVAGRVRATIDADLTRTPDPELPPLVRRHIA